MLNKDYIDNCHMAEVLTIQEVHIPPHAEHIGQLVVGSDLGVSFEESEGLSY